MAIAAGIGPNLGVSAMRTHIDMIAHLTRPAVTNRIHDTTVLGRDGMGGERGIAIPPEHVG